MPIFSVVQNRIFLKLFFSFIFVLWFSKIDNVTLGLDPDPNSMYVFWIHNTDQKLSTGFCCAALFVIQKKLSIMIILLSVQFNHFYLFLNFISDMFWLTRWSPCPGPASRRRRTTECCSSPCLHAWVQYQYSFRGFCPTVATWHRGDDLNIQLALL